jgi:hypothetical protein
MFITLFGHEDYSGTCWVTQAVRLAVHTFVFRGLSSEVGSSDAAHAAAAAAGGIGTL